MEWKKANVLPIHKYKKDLNSALKTTERVLFNELHKLFSENDLVSSY